MRIAFSYYFDRYLSLYLVEAEISKGGKLKKKLFIIDKHNS